MWPNGRPLPGWYLQFQSALVIVLFATAAKTAIAMHLPQALLTCCIDAAVPPASAPPPPNAQQQQQQQQEQQQLQRDGPAGAGSLPK
jgi:outer membrane biogenesis lipoprotein LolB